MRKVKKESKVKKEVKIKSRKKKLDKLSARDLIKQSNSDTRRVNNTNSGFNTDRKRANQSGRRRIEEDEFDKVAFATVKKNERKLGTQLLDADNKIVKNRKKSRKMFIDREEFMERVAREREESESEEEFDVMAHISDKSQKYENKDGLVMTKTEEFCRNIQIDASTQKVRRKKKLKEEAEAGPEEENDYGAGKISVENVGEL